MEPAVHDDDPVLGFLAEQMVKALGEEHEPGRIGRLRGFEETPMKLLRAASRIQQADVGKERRRCERVVDGVGERGRHLTGADAVPLDLAVERPRAPKCRVPEVAQRGPGAVANCDAAEREHREPAWSPDGKRIVFVHTAARRGSSPDLYVMNADGTGLKRLTRTARTAEWSPAWQPPMPS
jgi:hypothetical protein